MPVDIKVPAVGESITEGTIQRWLKKDGDPVKADETVCELETEKATTPVPSPASGVLRITVPEGSTVSIGTVIGRVEGEQGGKPPGKPAPREKEPAVKPSPSPDSKKAPANAAPAPAPMSPAARHHADDAGLDAGQLTGSGRGGRIIKEDVLAAIEQRQAPAAPQPAPPAAPQPSAPAPEAGARTETRQRMTSIRQRIAERLVAAQHSAALLTTFNEADLSAVMSLREKYKESFRKKHGVGLGFMSFFVKASVEALRAFPNVNSRIEGTDVVTPTYCDVGVAVSTEKGLMVPVLRNAERLTFAEVEKGIAELAEKARSGKITVADLQGGTFTITNGGVFGSLLSTPLLNPPQSGILGMHAIQKRPVAVDDQVVVRPMMYLALTYDHRIIDGREAVSFLVRVKECVETPERLLLEV
jgi:2-oxoglutarate dehydrogenase E2 component (dihydrolipoamide succinyltransferase)